MSTHSDNSIDVEKVQNLLRQRDTLRLQNLEMLAKKEGKSAFKIFRSWSSSHLVYTKRLGDIKVEMAQLSIAEPNVHEEQEKLESEMTSNFGMLDAQQEFLKDKRQYIDTLKKLTPVSPAHHAAWLIEYPLNSFRRTSSSRPASRRFRRWRSMPTPLSSEPRMRHGFQRKRR
jgi:hypothetical protein